MNSLLEQGVIDALYAASQAGVSIDLIVRGICALRPGVKGLSENIRVRSIVGRFLEHSRIFYFLNGGDAEIYAGSADWMPRNLFERCEVVFPVLDPQLRQRIREEILGAYLADTAESRFLLPSGEYVRTKDQPGTNQAAVPCAGISDSAGRRQGQRPGYSTGSCFDHQPEAQTGSELERSGQQFCRTKPRSTARPNRKARFPPQAKNPAPASLLQSTKERRLCRVNFNILEEMNLLVVETRRFCPRRIQIERCLACETPGIFSFPLRIDMSASPLTSSPVVRNPEVGRGSEALPIQRLWVWWHLLSLDAPTVAVVWCWFFAAAFGVSLPSTALVTLALGTWCVYVADRLLDGWRSVDMTDLRDRHWFYLRHRKPFVIAWIAAAAPLAYLILFRVQPAVRTDDIVLCLIGIGYFF